MTLVLHELEAWQGIGFTLPLHRAMHISQYSCILRHVQRSLGIMLMLIVFASAGPSGGGSMHGFGMSGPATGLFGAAATTPAFGQGTATVPGTSGFGPGTGQSSGAPFAFGASGGAPFGAQSSGGLFGASAASTSTLSTTPAGSAAGFTFGAQSSAASGGMGGAAPAFSTQPPSTGTWVSLFLGF